MIRVATYNIRKCVGLDWRRHPDRIMQVIAELDSDIVALQEADRRFGERPATLDVERMLEVTGLRPVSLDGGGPSSGWHGNTILIKDGMAQQVETAMLDLPSLEPRGALVARIAIGGRGLRVAAVHLGLRSADRRRQAQALLDHLGHHPPGGHRPGEHGPGRQQPGGHRPGEAGDPSPVIILGDLNEWHPHRGAVAVLAGDFTLSPPHRSFHSSAPLAALDRIMVGPGLRIEASGVHRSIASRRASDHLPVWADLAWQPAATGERHRSSAPDRHPPSGNAPSSA